MRSGCALGPPRNRALQAAAPSERQSRARSNSTPMPRPGAVLAQAPLPASTHETAAAPEQSAVDTAAGSGIVSRRHGGGGAATAAGAGADGTSATAATAGRSSAAPLVTSTSPQRRVPRPAITIAELDHGHMDAVRAIHTECFPVKYTDRFYRSLFAQAAVHVNLVAVDEGGQVVGVVTARDSEERRPSDDATELCPCIAPTDVPWPCNPWCAFWCCCEAVNRTGYVMTLGVTAAMRGCGIGRRLLRESMLRLFRDHGCADIALDCLPENEAAIALYQVCCCGRSCFLLLLRAGVCFGAHCHWAVLLP